MKKIKFILTGLYLLPTLIGYSQIECATDVVIAEGTAISMCDNAHETLNASAGFVSYAWSGPETGNGASLVPNFSGQYVVAATDGVGCVSHDTIQVTINPSPVDAIISSAGNTICPGGAGTVLSLTNGYVLYDWGGGVSTPTLTATTGGTYSVDVADANSCVGTFTIVLDEIQFDLTSSGTTGCEGGSAELIASGGTSYLWSTSETSSSIVVSPSSTTTYSVQITSGTCTQQLSTSVTIGVPLEFSMPDTIYIAENEQVFINGPENYSSYLWSPASAVNNPNASGVFFTGDQNQVITLQAVHPEGCVINDQVVVIIVRMTVPTGFSPNADTENDLFVIPELAVLNGKLIVWNRWGEIVYENENYKNDWGGTCEAGLCMGSGALPEGTYYYLLDVHGITFKGFLTLKR